MDGYRLQRCTQRQVAGRQSTVVVAARHVHRSKTSHIKRRAKKRDIRTSFIHSPRGTTLIQLPPVNTVLPPGWGPQQQAATAAAPTVAAPTAAAPEVAVLPVPISLGEACRTSRSTSEPVIALAAVTADVASSAAPAAVNGFATSSIPAAADWASEVNTLPPLPSLAALDSILDGLIVAPPSAAPVGASSSANSFSISSSSSLKSSKLSSKSSNSSSSRKGKRSSSAAAAAAPAVVSVQCEIDWARELAAAAANDQLVVVKVESGRNQLMRPAADPALRFQTHSIVPSPLNTYLNPTDNSSFSSYNPSSTLSSLGVNIGPTNSPQGLGLGLAASASSLDPSFTRSVLQSGGGLDTLASLGLYGLSNPAPSNSMSSSAALASSTRLDSPVHRWFVDLAQQYVSGSVSKGLACSPLKFLSLQSDSPRAKALCRKLGVSECLSVLVVDPSTGRKMLEVCGTKIEQELPSGLLYYADADTEGNRPSALLQPISTKTELENVRSSSDVSVVAFHMHAAPPCIKTYGVLYEAARTHTQSAVSFAVMDITSSSEHSELAMELDLQRLPTYVVYKGGKEVARLARTSERKRLGSVLQEVLSEAVVEPVLAVAAA